MDKYTSELIEIIEKYLIDDYIEEEELKEELETIQPDVLIDLMKKLIKSKKYDVLNVIIHNLDHKYIIKNKNKFETFIEHVYVTEPKIFMSELKSKMNKSKTLKNKLG